MRLFWHSGLREDVDAELEFHLEMHVRDLTAAGRSPAAAREEAERRFGELRRVREACISIDQRRREREHRREVFTDMLQDLWFAFRALRKSPGFALLAVLCIGLGVGVTSTILSAVHAILIRPLPYQGAEELVAIYARRAALDEHGVNIAYPDYVSWREDNKSFTDVGMWTWQALAFSGEGEPERVEGAMVTPNLFNLLGVRPLLGRNFLPEELSTTTPVRVVLLSYGLWQRRFGGDRGIVGRTITVDGFPHQVVGVMSQGFGFPDRGQAWLPFTVESWGAERANRGYAGAIARLKPGVSLTQAQRDLDVISARLVQEFPNDNRGWDAEAVSLREDLVGDMRRPLMVFLGAVGFVLLIVCANVANLMLTRGAARQREMAVRVAIGAGRQRLVRQLLTESMVLAGIGGLVGIAIAAVGVRLYGQAVPDGLPWYVTLRLDGMTVLFTVAIAVLTGILFGLMPAFRSTDLNLSGALREGTGGSGEGRQRARLRSALVVAEVALCLVLMIGAALLIQSYRALQGTQLGFERRGVLTLRLSLPRSTYDQPDKRTLFYATLFDRLAALPGISAVGSAQGIPMSGWNLQANMDIEGRPPRPEGQGLEVHYQIVSPDYFKTLEIPLIRGRNFTRFDRDTLNPVVLINQSLARKEFAGEDPLGKRIKLGGPGPWATIVGVVGDFRHYRLPQPMGPAVYYSYFGAPGYTQTLAIRTRGDPLDALPQVRGVLHELDPNLPAFQEQSLEQAVDRALWRQRLQGQVLGFFAALALVLAAVGIYGVISYGVAQRTRELGVRMALGASKGRVVGLVVRQGVLLALLGLGLGLAGALALTGVLTRLLYEVRATDLGTFIAVPLVLGAVAVLASWLPALRAARVDPLVAMRAE